MLIPYLAADSRRRRELAAILAHDVEAQLSRITAPTQITFGRYDQLTSTRFADRLKSGIRHSELVIFENSAHAPIYDSVEEFKQKTWRSCSAARGARECSPSAQIGFDVHSQVRLGTAQNAISDNPKNARLWLVKVGRWYTVRIPLS